MDVGSIKDPSASRLHQPPYLGVLATAYAREPPEAVEAPAVTAQMGHSAAQEWDEYPELIPTSVRQKLKDQDLAPLQLCHDLYTYGTSRSLVGEMMF